MPWLSATCSAPSVADDPHELALRVEPGHREVVEPWYRSTLTFDRHRLNEVHAEIEGERYDPEDDPSWTVGQALGAAAGKDRRLPAGNLSSSGVLKTPDELFADPGFLDKVMASRWRLCTTLRLSDPIASSFWRSYSADDPKA